MHQADGSIVFSATDLAGHLNCPYLTRLELAVAKGVLAKPRGSDPFSDLLKERGLRHERAFIASLEDKGMPITTIPGEGVDAAAVAATSAAMRAGRPIIVQAAFRASGAGGRADVLKRVPRPSRLGDWSYEIIDTKLAHETKGATVLQLCLYAELLAAEQGISPHHGHVITPHSGFAEQSFRMEDYQAYFRQVRGSLATAIESGSANDLYPHPVAHCENCRWRAECDTRRRTDDHLSYVAGISKTQIEELQQHGITTLSALAGLSLPLAWQPSRGAAPSFHRIREQARIQQEGNQAQRILHELLPIAPEFGLAAMPAPSAGDIFFDLESDPFVDESGLEFLFGVAFADPAAGECYQAQWAIDRDQEKSAFEGFIDFATARAEAYPDFHIYHYAPYEPAALKRLMGRYATRENQMDALLRSRRFVDLHAVVRHGLRASVESYSLKKLEPLYEFRRTVPLAKANQGLAKVNAFLELSDSGSIEGSDRDTVAGYNRDDCLSTWRLRDWLEGQRAALVAAGTPVPRPAKEVTTVKEDLTAWMQRIELLVHRLTEGLPADAALRNPAQQANWLLAHTLDWHRREQKAAWWEFFRLSDLSAEDLLTERAGLAGLTFVDAQGGTAKAPVHRYRFIPQETDLRSGEDLCNAGGDKLGSIEDISIGEGWIDIKKRMDSAAVHPEGVFSHSIVSTKVLAESLVRLGEWVAEHGVVGEGAYRAARDLLLRGNPRQAENALRSATKTTTEAALHLAGNLTEGLLAIQGPPGAGKTHTGAVMICALVAAGKTVGVTANSHKVIRNLLDETIKQAEAARIDLRCMQKADQKEANQPRLIFAGNQDELLDALGTNAQVGGGTAWVWAAPTAANVLDVLFIDEAAQMALANVLAVSQAARLVVLLGDPQQLEQPIKGSHPEGTDVSALHHLLNGAQTIGDEQGLFLAETWRLHPTICSFTSELFYDGRLEPRPGLERQAIRSAGAAQGVGLRYVPVPTTGRQNASPEEADRIRQLVDHILASGTRWIDKHGEEAVIRLKDILIIAPYNAQVYELKERLPDAHIGTVDKFQGQEAPIVIYSLTTSSHADAPRGMEFLYSLNRLNVATSRAKCLCILVASPTAFNVQCRTPRQMQLANAFCRYLELATVIEL